MGVIVYSLILGFFAGIAATVAFSEWMDTHEDITTPKPPRKEY